MISIPCTTAQISRPVSCTLEPTDAVGKRIAVRGELVLLQHKLSPRSARSEVMHATARKLVGRQQLDRPRFRGALEEGAERRPVRIGE